MLAREILGLPRHQQERKQQPNPGRDQQRIAQSIKRFHPSETGKKQREAKSARHALKGDINPWNQRVLRDWNFFRKRINFYDPNFRSIRSHFGEN